MISPFAAIGTNDAQPDSMKLTLAVAHIRAANVRAQAERPPIDASPLIRPEPSSTPTTDWAAGGRRASSARRKMDDRVSRT